MPPCLASSQTPQAKVPCAWPVTSYAHTDMSRVPQVPERRLLFALKLVFDSMTPFQCQTWTGLVIDSNPLPPPP